MARREPNCADVLVRLRKHLPAYDKTDLDFAKFEHGIAGAVERSKSLDPTGDNHGGNPTTNVWRLVEKIMER